MMLASAGKDRTVVIWQLKVNLFSHLLKPQLTERKATPKEGGGIQYSVIPLHHLREHRDLVDSLAWSPDGKILVTGAAKSLYMWNTEVISTGCAVLPADRLQTGSQNPMTAGTSQHSDTISAIHWKPDGSEFLVSSMDCKLVFYVSWLRRAWILLISSYRAQRAMSSDNGPSTPCK